LLIRRNRIVDRRISNIKSRPLQSAFIRHPLTLLAILADLHGNLPALEAVQADLRQFPVDHVIVAGDVINWGPFSAQVLERVVECGWAVIRGNNEFYLLDYATPHSPPEWNDRTRFPLLPWLKRQLAGRAEHLIAAWPDSLSLRFPNAPPIRVVHGSPRGNSEGITPIAGDDEIGAMLSGVDEPIVIAAHTHLPLARRVGGWQIYNPGSIGVPLDGQHCARYLLLESAGGAWRPTPRDVPVDPAPVLAEFVRQGFVEECGVIGQLVVAEFEQARLVLVPFLNWHTACCPHEPLTHDLVRAFAAIDPMPFTPAAYRLNLRPTVPVARELSHPAHMDVLGQPGV
jgi:predicted phosphodiesterase